MREKSLSVHRDYGDFLEWFFYIQSRLLNAKSIFECIENTLKDYSINEFGEPAKGILPYMENTPIDIKASLSRQIFDQFPKKMWSLITLLGMIEWAKNPTHAIVPLMRPVVISCTFWLYFLNRNFEEVSNFENSVSQKSLNCSAPDELHAPKELGMFCTWGTLCPEKKGWNALHLRNTRRLKNVLYLRTLYSGRL